MQYGKVWAFAVPLKPVNFVLIDPAAMNHILKANFDNYVKVAQHGFRKCLTGRHKASVAHPITFPGARLHRIALSSAR